MAVSNKADVRLLFGVQGKGSLSGESGTLIKNELTQIITKINKTPLRIKVSADASSIANKSWSNQIQKKLNELSKSGNLSVRVSKVDVRQGALTDFKKQINSVLNTIGIDKGVSISIKSNQLGQIKSEARQSAEEITNMARAAAQFKAQMDVLDRQRKSTASALDRLSKENLSEDEASSVSSLRAQYEKYYASIEEVRALNKVMSSEDRARIEESGNAIMEEIRLINQKRDAEAKANAAKAAADEQSKKNAKEAMSDAEKRNGYIRQAESLLVRVTKAQRDWGAASSGKSSDQYDDIVKLNREINVLISRLKSGEGSLDSFKKDLSDLNTRFVTASSAIKNAGENTQTLAQRMGGLASKFGAWLTVSQLIMHAVQSAKQMVSAVIDVDTAMTELKKVTSETDRTYSQFLDDAIVRAKELGTTVSDIVTATADFARLGYNISDASSLADAAVVYKNVGDGIEDISTASESIISTMKAFNIEASMSMSIVDKFNEVGNNFAISSSGVGDALTKSASALSAAGNSLDESIALITAMNSTVQDPDKVGTTLKTLTMYLRAAKTEAEAAGESTDGMADSVSELRDEILSLTGGKVDIQIDEDTFKSTYQIMKEISSVYDDLTDVSQANLLEMIGGKRNSDAVMSLIKNFQTAEEVLDSTANAAGSAMAENEKYMESINGHISVFRASFQELSATVIDSDFIKTIIDIGVVLLNMITSLANVVDAVGGLNTVLVLTAGIIASIKIDKIISFLSKIPTYTSSVSSFFASIYAGFVSAKSSGSSTLSAITAGLKQAGIAASSLQIALTAAFAVISIAIMAINSYNASIAEARQEAIDNAKSAASLTDEISSLTSKYLELSDAVNTNSASKEDLISTQNELIKKIGIEKSELQSLTEEYGNLSDAVKAATIESLQDSERDLRSGVNASGDELIGAAKPGFFGGSLNSFSFDVNDLNRDEISAALEALEEADLVVSKFREKVNESGDIWGLNVKLGLENETDAVFSTVDGVISAYERLGTAMDIVGDTIGSDNQLYEAMSEQYNSVKDAVNGYQDSISSLNKNLAEQQMLQSLIGEEIPKTQSEFDSYRDDVVSAAIESGEYIGSVSEIEDAIDGVLSSQSQFSAFYKDTVDTVSGSAGVYSASLSSLSDTLSKLQSSYSALESAQSDMASGKGLSAETISALADEEEDYIKYLYEENGVIKLNTDAWKENANAKIQSDMGNIQDEIDALKDKNDSLRESLVLYRERQTMGDTSKSLSLEIDAVTKELEENNAAIAENQGLLAIYSSLYGDITGDLNAYSSALSNFDVISSTIDSASNSFTTLANLQAEVANGFTMSLDRALEFASVYPEILNSATAASNGQISLNEDVVNSFISGKKAEIDAQIDSEIAKLEADKAVLTAKMEYSKAQLDLAKNVGEGEGQISKEVAEYRLSAGNAVTQALIAAGVDEATAYQLAYQAMAGNAEEFNRVAAEVCTDIQGNFNQAAYDAAQSIYTNMQNSKLSIASVAEQAHQAAIAIAGVGSGTVQGSSSVNGGGAGGSYTGKGSITVTSGTFKGTEFSYEAKTVQLEDFISDLELDISNYANAIAQIDGQIAALKALRNTSLNKYQSSSSGSSGSSGSGGSRGSGSSGSSSSQKTEIDNWFEREYALHNHLIEMDTENVEDYLDWLNSAYQKAYKEGLIDLEDFYQYQEEVYNGLRDLFRDYISDVEHEISMRENFESETKKIIELYNGLIDSVEKEIKAARAQGLDDTDDYIQELQDKWWDYTNALQDMRDEATENAKSAVDSLVDYQLDIIKQNIEDEKDALDQKLDQLKDFYDKQKEMLQEQYDEEQYLKEQSEKRKSVTDIQAELAMLEYDDSAWAQKRKLELQQELSEAQEDLASFEDEHALDEALGALDSAYESQEAQIEAEMEALDKKLNDPDALYNQALAAIKDNTGNLYEEMLQYNRDHGTGNDEDVKDIYEEAYKALLEYKKIFGEDYKGVTIDNSTGYQQNTGSWNTSIISGTNPSNKPQQGGSQSGGSSSGSSSSSKPQSKPSLSSGSTITVKTSATHFGSKSGGLKMASFVPGGTYTVYGTSGDQVLIGRNGVYTGWIKRSDIVGYAKGTRNATPGIHAIDEIGSEYVFTSSDGTNYRVLNGGDKVLNAKATDFLYTFATSGGRILDKIVSSLFGNGIKGVSSREVYNEIRLGDIVVNGNADHNTVSEIRRAQRESLTEMLKALNKLNK